MLTRSKAGRRRRAVALRARCDFALHMPSSFSPHCVRHCFLQVASTRLLRFLLGLVAPLLGLLQSRVQRANLLLLFELACEGE